MSETHDGGGEQVAVLREIWGELKAVRSTLRTELLETRTELKAELREVHAELRETRNELSLGIARTNERLEEVRDELKADLGQLAARMTESEVRLATATTELVGTVRDLTGHLAEWREEHREDRADLRRRVDRLERHTGLAS
jgi:chromosome segregation ATPase